MEDAQCIQTAYAQRESAQNELSARRRLAASRHHIRPCALVLRMCEAQMALSVSSLERSRDCLVQHVESLHSSITGPGSVVILYSLQKPCVEHEGHRAAESGS